MFACEGADPYLPSSSDFGSLYPTNVLNAHQDSWTTCGASAFQLVGVLSTSVFHYILTQSRPCIVTLRERLWRL